MYTIIFDGADGPTSIFLAGKLGMNWLNVFGLIIIVLLLIPNVIYALKFRKDNTFCQSRAMNILEQIGRYASMFLMVFNIGIAEFGFSSVAAFLCYLLGNLIFVLLYWIIWMMYFVKQSRGKSLALAIIPTLMFLFSGVTLRHVLLIVSSVVFGIGHIYITYQSNFNKSE